MKKAVLIRTPVREQTPGILVILDGIEKVFECNTLELPWKGNKREESCIPAGEYLVKKVISPTFGECFEVTNVENRTAILVHPGNFKRDTRGCILPGDGFRDIDGDGLLDVVNSKITLERIKEKCDCFILKIIEL